MNRILTILSVCFVTTAAVAQQKADIIVSYDVTYPTLTGNTRTDKMLLLANNDESKYFNELSLWTDSLSSTPDGKAQLLEIIKKACMTIEPDGSIMFDHRKGPVKTVWTYVFNIPANGELTFYGKWGDDKGYYTEPLNEINWNIVGDSTATILDYECVMAETDYHGRHWKAWFAPEIPVPFGPWKLQGLPGLIMKAETDANFSFVSTGIESTDRIITPMYLSEEYSKVDRRKALSDAEHYRNNLQAMMNANGDGKVTIRHYDDDGNEIDPPVFEAQKHAIEPDYK